MITPEFPVIELIDRYAISYVKQQKTNNANSLEFEFYKKQITHFNLSLITDNLEELISIHNEIWELERELKSGKEHLLPFDEIGRRAIKIRDKNNRRVQIKNQIAEILGCRVREIKQDHLSQ